MFAIAPTIRNWLGGSGQRQRGSVAIGGTIAGMAGCEVVASRHDRWPVGARMIAMARWEDWSVIAPDMAPVPAFRLPDGIGFAEALGPLSLNSLTAYFGMRDVGQVAAGETVLVSGAAGSVGSVACQIARIAGARVVGIAGGRDKCAWLREECGVDAAIDYRAEDVAARLAALCPDGIDLFFDNVGGATLEAGIAHIARFGRIVLCGAISGYNDMQDAPGPRNLTRLISQRAEMRGFILLDHLDRVLAAMAELRQWASSGQIRYRTDVQHGFDAIPQTFLRLFDGSNQGKQLLRIDEVAGGTTDGVN